jgi:N-terminal acetyltransferase B complex catalytic subunit
MLVRGKMYFVDLFVRESNRTAIGMYEKFGYTVYRRVLGYYSGANPEDGLGNHYLEFTLMRFWSDMRKALSRDVSKRSVVPLPYPVHANDLDY